MSEFKIEKGIPAPSRSRYPFHEMEVGDSFLFNKDQLAVMTAAMANATRKGNGKFSMRKQDNGTYRVWRVE